MEGIILHQTPTPYDPTYNKHRNSTNKANYLIKQNAPLTVLAEGNEENEGWVYVRSQSGEEGWIERRYTAKKPNLVAKSSFDTYTVKKGDNLEGLIRSYYTKYPTATGNDDRTIALAIYLYNKDRPGSGVYRDYGDYVKSKKVNAAVNALDYWMIETRANYQSVKLYTGGEVVLPPVSYINEMRRRGELEKRPDFVNTLVDTGQVIRGLYDGVNEGFFEAFVSTGEDLYNMIVDIFTGEIFNQITDLFSMFMEKGLEGVWEMIKDFGMATWAEVQAAWNNPNAYERGKYSEKLLVLSPLKLCLLCSRWVLGQRSK